MQLVLGIRELLCDHCTLFFFFLKPYVKATVHKRGGGPIFSHLGWRKKKFLPGVCLFIKKIVLWSNPKSCMHCSNIFLCCNVACISCVYKQLYSNACKLLWMKICMRMWWISFMNNKQIWLRMNFISLGFRISFFHPLIINKIIKSSYSLHFTEIVFHTKHPSK